MISAHERADLIHIMKVNRLTLIEADMAYLTFNEYASSIDYEITVLIVEDTPSVLIKKNGATRPRRKHLPKIILPQKSPLKSAIRDAAFTPKIFRAWSSCQMLWK